MALTNDDLSIKLYFDLDNDRFRIKDETDYAGASVSTANVVGVYSYTDPNDNILHENVDFDNPDVDVDSSLYSEYVSFTAVEGTQTIVYSVYDSDTDTDTTYTKTFTFTYDADDIPDVVIGVESNVGLATIESTDETAYADNITLNSRTHTLTYPASWGSTTETSTLINSISLTNLYTGEYTASIESNITIENTDGLVINITISGEQEHNVWDSDGMYALRTALRTLFSRWQSYQTSNPKRYRELSAVWNEVNANYTLFNSAKQNGDIENAGTYLNNIKTLLAAENIDTDIDPSVSVPVSSSIPGYASRWLRGSGEPSASTGRIVDFYYRTDTNQVYTKESGSWVVDGYLGYVYNFYGDVTNATDEEDTTSTSSVIKFKDRNSNGDNLGYKIIRQDFDFSNIPIGYDNSIWEIRYVHDLGGITSNFPDGVTLYFNGGILINGTVNGDNTRIKAHLSNIFGTDLLLGGSWIINEMFPQWFGAVGDGVVDDTESIKSCILSSQNVNVSTINFPISDGYLVSDTIIFDGTCNIYMESPIISDISMSSVGISILGQQSKSYTLSIQKKTTSDWTSEDSIGILFTNTNTCIVNIIKCIGFTIGISGVGDAGGFAYNVFYLNILYNNKIHINLKDVNNGYANENTFYNGRIGCDSNVNTSLSRYGVRITSDGTYANNNNNKFLNQSFELKTPVVGEAIPILMEYGKNNYFLNFRNEGNSATAVRSQNISSKNIYIQSYGNGIIDEQSIYPDSYIQNANDVTTSKLKRTIFNSSNLLKKACFYDATKINIAGVFLSRSSGGSTIYNATTDINLGTDYLELAAGVGVSIRIYTDIVKTFLVQKNTETNYGGRQAIRCYDSSGTILTDSDINHPYVKGSAIATFSWDGVSFGGVYKRGVDSSSEDIFTVHEDVKYIDLIIAGVSSDLHIKSFSVSTYEKGGCPTYVPFEEISIGNNIALNAPLSGTWSLGKTVYNASPSAGSYQGWICVSAGTPGTWKGFGLIES